MRKLQQLYFRFRTCLVRNDRGASLVEYALLVALIAIVCFVAVEFLGGSTSSAFDRYGDSLTAARN